MRARIFALYIVISMRTFHDKRYTNWPPSLDKEMIVVIDVHQISVVEIDTALFHVPLVLEYLHISMSGMLNLMSDV